MAKRRLRAYACSKRDLSIGSHVYILLILVGFCLRPPPLNMPSDSVEEHPSLSKSDVKEEDEQGYTPPVLPNGGAPALSRRSTTNKHELEGAPPETETVIEERWLTGRKLLLVHCAMLLSSVGSNNAQYITC